MSHASSARSRKYSTTSWRPCRAPGRPDATPGQAVIEVLDQWRQFLVARLSLLAGTTCSRLRRAPLSSSTSRRTFDPSGYLPGWARTAADMISGAERPLWRSRRPLRIRLAVVTIHGEDQLLEPEDGDLFLHLVRLEHVATDRVGSVARRRDYWPPVCLPETLFEALSASRGIAAPTSSQPGTCASTFGSESRFPLMATRHASSPTHSPAARDPSASLISATGSILTMSLTAHSTRTSTQALVARLSGDGRDRVSFMRFSEPYSATGGLAAEGVLNQLGRPDIEPLEVLVREAVQNCWDARRDSELGIRVEIGRRHLDDAQQATFCTRRAARDPPPGLPLRDELGPGMQIMYFADFGTSGLGGPTRADVAGADATSSTSSATSANRQTKISAGDPSVTARPLSTSRAAPGRF